MLNKEIQIFCKYSDNIQVQQITDIYVSRGLMQIELKDDIVRLLFKCNIFKLKKLKHDLNILNNIGIKTEIKEA